MTDVFSCSPVDISSAIRSVAEMKLWSFGKMCRVPKFSVPGHERLSSLLTDQETREEPQDPEEEEVAVVSFKSKYIHICPLYQDYCLQDVKEDLQRLNNKRSLTELIAPQYLQGLQSRLNLQPSSPERTPPPPDGHVIRVSACTLWRDLEEVKAAGLLGLLTPGQVRLQECMFELIGSEASYLRSLGVAVDHFCASKALQHTLSRLEHHTLFSNIRHVKAASEKFLMDLEIRLGESVFMSQLGDIVLDHSPSFRTRYVPYVTNMMYQEALVKHLLLHNPDFVASLKQLEDDPVCQRQNLKSFLVLPFQRITRIKLILQSIIKLTEEKSESLFYLEKAKEAIHEIVKECDEGIQKMKFIEQLLALEMLLDFGQLKAVPLVVSGRFLVHEGPLNQLTVESSCQTRTSLTNIHLHLFNDLLIISSKREQHFLVEDHAEFPSHVHMVLLKTEAVGLPPNSFVLRLSRGQSGRPTAMILVAHSRSDMEQWMKVLLHSMQ
ncbi:rho guanine nucleotide exchange factor 19 isoform X2 [Entelurus aequoreus]|uniref:rho guanine nucleotide exchange factor 19 isoform X2 n=1 Tax=Entelurus aequoreus TaxID=161455 RepID=UPI002B1D65F3|nr:rho guanine nucleotide exchange factor 19 isoform X2 [Entelurus aequoreus]